MGITPSVIMTDEEWEDLRRRFRSEHSPTLLAINAEVAIVYTYEWSDPEDVETHGEA